MAKRNQHAKQGFGVETPQDAIHMGEGKRIRLEDVPLPDSTGDQQVGNRAYNDERYQLKGGTTNNQASFLVGGFWVYTGVDLIFETVLTELVMPGYDTPFVFPATTINLADYPALDNGTFPQYVRPMWDINTGVPVAIFGDASADPGVPSVSDPLTQIAGNEFLLNAGATTIDPGEVQTTVIFAEGSPGEFSFIHTGPGSANYANAAAPIAGLIDGLVQSVQNNSREIGSASADFDPTDFETISLDLKLLAAMATGYNLAIQFWNNANTPVSSVVNLPIDKANTGIQKVGLAISDFTFSAGLARKVVLHWRRGSGSVTFVGYQFDNFVLQGGLAVPIVQGDVVLQGQVSGSGKTGTPIQVSITEKAISDQTLQTDPLPSTALHWVRLADGSLRKVPDNLIASNKVDKVAGKSLIDDTEIARLAGINDRFKGKYTSLSALETAVPTANAGDYAQVDTGGSNPVTNYNWDVEDGWVIGSTGGASISNTDELPEGTTNLYHTAARVLNTIITGVSFATNRAIVATDSILVALGLLQKQITDNGTAIGDNTTAIAGKQATLVSGTNIKTVNGNSLLGAGNINVGGMRVFNVEDYGAVHDGTTDDTTAIQAAINAAFSAGGGRVYFPKGIYIIGGALQTNVGGINYNSQLYIPNSDQSNLNRSTIEFVGEFAPCYSAGGGLYEVINPNSCSILRSTIQGSGTKPSVIASKGAASNYIAGRNFTSAYFKDLCIQVTPNGSSKVTIGGINGAESVSLNIENVTIFPHSVGLFNINPPDVINVSGVMMPLINCDGPNQVYNCVVGGFTNGFEVSDHTNLIEGRAYCCVNGILIKEFYQTAYIQKLLTHWCNYDVAVDSSTTFCYINISHLQVEWRQNSKWYDTVAMINDPNSAAFGKINFNIVEANVGLNNDKFKKVGGNNLLCHPVSLGLTSQITATSYTLKYSDAFKKNKANSSSAQTITIPPNSSVTYDIDQEIVIQRLGTGSVTITPGSGVTLNIPSGFLAKIKGQYDAVSLVQTAINVWVIYGALEATP